MGSDAESKKERAARLLKADPGLKSVTVAEIVGCSHATVVHARQSLGPVGRKASKLERCEALLREDADLDLQFVADAVGCCRHTAYLAARRLGVSKDRRYASAIGTHQHWHVKHGRPDPGCALCQEEDPSLGIPGAVAQGG